MPRCSSARCSESSFPDYLEVPLLEAVQQHCTGGGVVRSDWVKVTDAPKAPTPMPSLPSTYKTGALSIDCTR